MRLRTIMAIVFCISAIVPMLLFWLWPHSSFLGSKGTEVNEPHEVVASSLAAELGRYHQELTTSFQIAVENVDAEGKIVPMPLILDRMEFKNICVVEIQTGKVVQSIQSSGLTCPEQLSEQQLLRLLQMLERQERTLTTTPVMSVENHGNVIYTLYRKDTLLYVGAVSSEYVSSVGKRIQIGTLGHAAIFDQAGKVLSHPNAEWQISRKSFEDAFAFDVMKSRGSGVEVVISPETGQETLAGYAHVPNVGWTVMVFQPISELESEVAAFKYTTFTIMAIGMVLAIALAYFASKLFTFPLEQMIQAMKRIGNGELRAHEQIKESVYDPLEFEDAREAIKAMAKKLQENIDTISRHAYLDGITGLPNRECFKVLAQEHIEILQANNSKGAILFLDLDGFKQVNDIYGHRSGDDLLKGFADKIHLYCGNEMKRRAYGADNAVNILPARLGGDEFVIFLGNIKNEDTVEEFAKGLFSRVFGKFKLHNGVSLQVNGSVGGALFPDQGSDFDELLRLADIAMYKAKNGGKGRFCLHQEGDPIPEEEPYQEETPVQEVEVQEEEFLREEEFAPVMQSELS
ncbi:MAG: diguanylate cyclase [Pseudomonadota bacterium]